MEKTKKNQTFKKQLPEKIRWKPLPRVLSVENTKCTFQMCVIYIEAYEANLL